MEMVYLLNGSGSGGGGDNSVGYPFVKAVVTDGAVGIQDRTVTQIELKTSDAVRINFPPKTGGVARDFLLRLVITADTVPEVTFAAPTGETFSFEEGEDETFACLTGVNIFAFTETADGCFVVNRKLVSVAQQITFDPNGGSVDVPVKDYILGAKYGELPVPVRTGYVFQCWQTEDGAEVAATDTVKTSVTKLVAKWEEYVDKFEPVIAPGSGLLFTTDGNVLWTIEAVDGEDVARTGAIGHSQRSSLYTTVTGKGTLSFSWMASTENNFDKCQLYVDKASKGNVSGIQTAWNAVTCAISTEGEHKVEWRFSKDASVSKGSDCVWLKDVKWEAS